MKTNEKFRDQWRKYNQTRDLFWDKKQEILQNRHKADIMEKVVEWLEFGSHQKMETVFKLDIPLSNKTPEDESAQSQAWIEVIKELTEDGFNMTHCQGGLNKYHLVLKIVSDDEEKKIKKQVGTMIKKVKKDLNK
jgi:hypothetical protein